MSLIKTIKDYIYYNQRPFISTQIVDELGICYETVKKCLQTLQAEGYVRQIGTDKGKKVYVYNKNQTASHGFKVKQKHNTLESIQDAYQRQLRANREWFNDLLDLL